MKLLLFLFLTIIFFTFGMAQTEYNLNFEAVDTKIQLPRDWKYGNTSEYILKLDSTIVKDGKYSLSLSSVQNTKSGSYGVCTYVIPAKFAGDTIELRGYLKTLNVGKEGFAGLWMRIDGESGYLAFDNMRNINIKGTNEWQEYSIRLPLNEEATKIFIGGLLSGTGTIWIDNLRLFFNGEEIDKAPKKKVKVYKAQLDSAFYDGSKVNLTSVNDTQIKNLSILGKIWGFLKYYHPQIAEGNYNWDFELFRILPKVISSKSKKERDNYLLGWIDDLGAITPCDTCKIHIIGDHKQIPDLAWINNKNLEPILKKKLDFIHKNRNQKKNYYISFAPGVGNPVFKHENPYEDLLYPDAGYRILALFKYWNIIQYFSPYKYTIGEDWNNVLDESIPKLINAKDALEYRLECLKLIGRTNDTHANIWGQDSILSAYHGKYYPPVQAKFIEDQLVITDYFDNDLGKKSGLRVGDIITSIDNIEVNEIVKNKLFFYPASNYPTKLRDIARNILKGDDEKAKIEILRDHKKTIRILERVPPDSLDMKTYWASKRPDSCYKFITDDIGYIYLGNIKSKLIPTIFKRFKDTRGIVIDIRNYPSEFVVFSLGKYLVPQPMEFVKFTCGDINYPGLFNWTPALKVGEENPDYYKGKVVILINEITLSQAEYTTMAFRTAPNAVVVGSTTAGADGNVSPFYLPGNIRTLITGIGVYYPDGQETQRIGIIPDVEVKPTIKGIKEGRDELLEKAIEIINKSK